MNVQIFKVIQGVQKVSVQLTITVKKRDEQKFLITLYLHRSRGKTTTQRSTHYEFLGKDVPLSWIQKCNQFQL